MTLDSYALRRGDGHPDFCLAIVQLKQPELLARWSRRRGFRRRLAHYEWRRGQRTAARAKQ